MLAFDGDVFEFIAHVLVEALSNGVFVEGSDVFFDVGVGAFEGEGLVHLEVVGSLEEEFDGVGVLFDDVSEALDELEFLSYIFLRDLFFLELSQIFKPLYKLPLRKRKLNRSCRSYTQSSLVERLSGVSFGRED